MNGSHDVGGMHGFGPVQADPEEPLFHAPWERTVFGMLRATLPRCFNIDEFRHAIERMGNIAYLDSTYYEHWLACLEMLLVEKGVLDAGELDARVAAAEAGTLAEPPLPAQARITVSHPGGIPYWREGPPPRFAEGDRVRARNLHPRGHTRLPRYARGRRGVIAATHGVMVYPDSNAHGQGEQPQAVYSVRFAAEELWGADAEGRGAVFLDLWESYLEPDEERR